MQIFLTVIAVFFGIRYVVKKSEILSGFNIKKSDLQRLHQFYKAHFPFYNLLKPKEKHRFLVRIVTIRKSKELRINPEINNPEWQIELLICAAFAQITFGYKEYEIKTFGEIIISPGEFYSKLANNTVKGLTVGTGYMFFSWEDFLKGYISSTDRINLALHELAHALYIDRFHEYHHDDWELWKEQAGRTLGKLRDNPDQQFFREYGKTNLSEFWAVSVETFFEDPVNFLSLYPELYLVTARVLRQDMAGRMREKEINEK